jgi:hypothetical protein
MQMNSNEQQTAIELFKLNISLRARKSDLKQNEKKNTKNAK